MKVDPFRIIQEEMKDEYILHISGELDLSVVPQFRSALDPVLKRTDKTLTLNLKDLTYIDSTGIGIIVSILKIRDASKAPFFVKEIPASIQRLFDLTGISKYLAADSEDRG